MEAKHTPGPWKDGPVFQRLGRAIFITDTSKGGKWNRRLDDGGVFHEDDARLIAASPELLEAAMAMVKTEMFLPDHPQRRAAYAAARAAIALATQ